jgi:hypothetical protein
MIVEAILIGQLLKKLSLQSTPTVVGPPRPRSDVIKKLKPGVPSLKPPDAPKPIFEVDPEVFADVIKLKRYF